MSPFCADLVDLAGCVAIANRKTEGCQLSLEDFSATEWDIFSGKMTTVSAECPKMPDDFKAKIQDYMTIQQLIHKLDQQYRKFIEQVWMPDVLSRLSPKVAEMLAELRDLGPNVDTLETQHVLQH